MAKKIPNQSIRCLRHVGLGFILILQGLVQIFSLGFARPMWDCDISTKWLIRDLKARSARR